MRYVEPSPELLAIHGAGLGAFAENMHLAHSYYGAAARLHPLIAQCRCADERQWRRAKVRTFLRWARHFLQRALGALERDTAPGHYVPPRGINWERIGAARTWFNTPRDMFPVAMVAGVTTAWARPIHPRRHDAHAVFAMGAGG